MYWYLTGDQVGVRRDRWGCRCGLGYPGWMEVGCPCAYRAMNRSAGVTDWKIGRQGLGAASQCRASPTRSKIFGVPQQEQSRFRGRLPIRLILC